MTSFFIRLQEQHDAIADWSEATVKKLKLVLNRILRENDYKDSMMDILQKFMSLQDGKTLIFPRYHQLDVVHKLVADVRQKGAWQHYLIQHSAGSGKSNSIALDVDAPSTRNVSVRKCCPPESCTVCKGHRQPCGQRPCQRAEVRQERSQQGKREVSGASHRVALDHQCTKHQPEYCCKIL